MFYRIAVILDEAPNERAHVQQADAVEFSYAIVAMKRSTKKRRRTIVSSANDVEHMQCEFKLFTFAVLNKK